MKKEYLEEARNEIRITLEARRAEDDAVMKDMDRAVEQNDMEGFTKAKGKLMEPLPIIFMNFCPYCIKVREKEEDSGEDGCVSCDYGKEFGDCGSPGSFWDNLHSVFLRYRMLCKQYGENVVYTDAARNKKRA